MKASLTNLFSSRFAQIFLGLVVCVITFSAWQMHALHKQKEAQAVADEQDFQVLRNSLQDLSGIPQQQLLQQLQNSFSQNIPSDAQALQEQIRAALAAFPAVPKAGVLLDPQWIRSQPGYFGASGPNALGQVALLWRRTADSLLVPSTLAYDYTDSTNPENQWYTTTARTMAKYQSTPFSDPQTKQTLVAYSAPLFDKVHRFMGALVTFQDLLFASTTISSVVLRDKGYILLSDPKGTVWYDSYESSKGFQKRAKHAWVSQIPQDSNGSISLDSLGSTRIQRVAGSSWYLVRWLPD